MRSFRWVLELQENPRLLANRWHFFDFVISKSKKSRPFYEFGVWQAKHSNI